MDDWCAGGEIRNKMVLLLLEEGEEINAAIASQKLNSGSAEGGAQLHNGDGSNNIHNNIKRCVQIVSNDGDLQKGIQALTSHGCAGMTDDVVQQLIDKHPQDVPLPNCYASECEQILVTKDDVLAAVKSFKKSAAPGRSGMRPTHIINGIANRADFLNNFTVVIQLMVNAQIPAELAQIIAGGPLIPLLKKDGGIRPITIGEVIKRVTSKIAIRKTMNKFQQLVDGIQLGVGIKNGIEAVLHCLNNVLRSDYIDENDLTILVDFTNAFNLTARQPFIDIVKTRLPEILKWVQFLYCTASFLFLPGGKIILCCTGVQQGDPLSMALFCLAAHPLLFQLSQIISELAPHKPTLVAAICDDVTLLVPDAATAAKCIQLIDLAGPALGLMRSRTKSVIWSPKQHSSAQYTIYLENFFAGAIKISNDSGVELLGGALSIDNIYLGTVAKKRVNKAIEQIHLLLQIDDPQICLLLLRQCLGTNKLTYCFRTMPPEALEEPVALFREVLTDALRTIVVNNGSRMGEFHMMLASLPVSLSGLGITMPEDVVTSAALASQIQTFALQRKIYPAIGTCERRVQAMLRLQNKFADSIHPLVQPDNWFHFFQQISSHSRIQYTLTDLMYRSKREHLLMHPFLTDQPDSVVRQLHQKILASNAFQPTQRQQHSVLPVRRTFDSVANHWLHAMPCAKYQQVMSPRDFRAALALRMLLPILPAAKPCDCGGSVMDIHGYHALVCSGIDNSRTKRHDHLRDAVFDFLRLTNFNPIKNAQVQCLGMTSHGSHLFRPADCLFDGDDNMLTCLDITVASPLSHSRCSKAIGAVVLEAAKKKWNKHLAPCQQAHFDFMPFAVDVCGLIDWAAVSLLKRIACKYSEITLKSYAECVSIVRRRISFAIQSGVARQLSRAVLLYC